MSDILAISSHVSFGAVGNAIAIPAMEANGWQVSSMPTIILSNHPGLGKPVGMPIAPDIFAAMLKTLDAPAWLDNMKAIMTGYFASVEQVIASAEFIKHRKQHNSQLIYLCDPVLGDDHTGLYIASTIAESIRDYLLPLADFTTPNRYELDWLSSTDVSNIRTAITAARKLPCAKILATSLPGPKDEMNTVLITQNKALAATTCKRPNIPHGTGDLLSGLFLSEHLATGDDRLSLTNAMNTLEHVVQTSHDNTTLRLSKLYQPHTETTIIFRDIA